MKYFLVIFFCFNSLNLSAGIFGSKKFSCKFFTKGQIKREGSRISVDDLKIEGNASVDSCYFDIEVIGSDTIDFLPRDDSYKNIKSFKRDLIDSLQSIYNSKDTENSEGIEVNKRNFAHFLYYYYVKNENNMSIQAKKITTCLMYSEICKTKIVRKLLDITSFLYSLSLPLKVGKAFLKKFVFKKHKKPSELFKFFLKELKVENLDFEKENMFLDIIFKYYQVYKNPQTDSEEWMVNQIQSFGNKKYTKVERIDFDKEEAIKFLTEMTNEKLIDKANKFFKEKTLSKVLGNIKKLSPLADLVDVLDLVLFNDKGPICKDLKKKILELQDS